MCVSFRLLRSLPSVPVLLVLHGCLCAVRADEPDARSLGAAMEVLRETCGDCHADGAAEGGLALERLEGEESLRARFEQWEKMRQRLIDRSMPPADSEALPDPVRESLVAWIESASRAAICRDGPEAGSPLLRRLARHEYANTIRDLLNIHFDAGQGLPEDAAGGEGFANAAETLTISPLHAEQYLQSALDALDYAARDARARERLLAARPGPAGSEEAAARRNVHDLASRAFRRPVPDDALDPYLRVFRDAREDGLPFDDAVLFAMRGVLISPQFLFISETDPTRHGVAELLSDHELATRLSYFLWASTPDDELRARADAGALRDDTELATQTLRLVNARGTHLQDAMEHFVGQWLGTADLGRTRHIDRERHPWVADPHVAALRNQPVYTMVSILQQNESILALIDAPWTFLNDELARLYRIRKDAIQEEFVQHLVRVNLPEEYRYRGGLLGMGGTLTVSSYPRRSSPVLRGAWVLEKMLGVELPPPPPNIPELDESAEAAQASTLRERLEQHRRDPTCASCHDRIDPVGFALENFDEIGRWRDRDEGGAIDPRAHLSDGTEIDGITGLKQHLMNEKDTFARVLTRKMLGYALGRSLRPRDLCTVELIVKRLQENDYRSQELVLGIVMSKPFREKISTGSERE